MKPIKILIADSNSAQALHLKSFLDERGFESLVTNEGPDALRMILKEKPQLVLMDLMLLKLNAIQILKELQVAITTGNFPTKIIIISNQTNIVNIKECMKLGASDYLIRPLDDDDIISRLVFHLQPSRSEEKSTNTVTSASNLYLHLIELILRQVNQSENWSETFLKLTQMTAMALKSVRVSVIKCELNRFGSVKASSDDTDRTEWTIDLKKYPEIQFVMNTEKTLVIENLSTDPVLNQIKRHFSTISFNSMIVLPLHSSSNQFYGVLAVRMPSDRAQILNDEVQFCQIIAQCINFILKLHRL